MTTIQLVRIYADTPFAVCIQAGAKVVVRRFRTGVLADAFLSLQRGMGRESWLEERGYRVGEAVSDA